MAKRKRKQEWMNAEGMIVKRDGDGVAIWLSCAGHMIGAALSFDAVEGLRDLLDRHIETVEEEEIAAQLEAGMGAVILRTMPPSTKH